MIVNLSDGGLLNWSPLGLTFDRSSVSGMHSIAGGTCGGQSGDAVLTPKS
jgi:hypothetical protein